MKSESYKQAVTRYKAASGKLYRQPIRELSVFERGGWFLHDSSDELIAIVNNKDVIFGANIAGFMLQSAQ